MNLLSWRRQPAIFPDQFKNSVELALLAQAVYLTFVKRYRAEALNEGTVPSWQSLDVETRRAYVNVTDDMLEQLWIEQRRDDDHAS